MKASIFKNNINFWVSLKEWLVILAATQPEPQILHLDWCELGLKQKYSSKLLNDCNAVIPKTICTIEFAGNPFENSKGLDN